MSVKNQNTKIVENKMIDHVLKINIDILRSKQKKLLDK